jgi:hypothetical protein
MGWLWSTSKPAFSPISRVNRLRYTVQYLTFAMVERRIKHFACRNLSKISIGIGPLLVFSRLTVVELAFRTRNVGRNIPSQLQIYQQVPSLGVHCAMPTLCACLSLPEPFLDACSLFLVALAATVLFFSGLFRSCVQNCSIFLDSRLMHCPLRNGPRNLDTDKWRHYFVLLK